MTKNMAVVAVALGLVAAAPAPSPKPTPPAPVFIEGVVLGPDAKPLALASQTIAKAMPGTHLRVTLSRSGDGVPSPGPGPQIRGRVRDAAGAPVADALVRGFTDAPGANGVPPLEARTQTDGTFVLGGASAPRYRLSLRVPGFNPVHRVVAAPSHGVELVLLAAPGIKGVVVDDGGRPIEAFRVSAVSDRGQMMRMVESETGRFALDDMPPATYTVEVTARDLGRQMVSNVAVATTGVTDVGIIRLSSGASVRGTVLDATSAPVAGATVEARGSESMSLGPSDDRQTTTDSAGNFQLHGLRPETVVIVARHPDFAEGRSAPVEIAEDRAAETNVVLPRGGRIEGLILRRGPGTLPEVSIDLQPLSPGAGVTMREMLMVGPDGRFAIDHVSPGRVAVMVVKHYGLRALPSAELAREVAVREGETARVEFVWREILLTGRVTRGIVPLRNIRLIAQNVDGGTFIRAADGGPDASTGPQHMTALTREDGSYEMIVRDVGRIAMTARSAGARVAFPVRMVDVADVESQTVDLAYPAGGISGLVVDQQTGAPVARASVSAFYTGPGGGGGGHATTGEDGRFVIDGDPGEFYAQAGAEGYAPGGVAVTVGDTPAPDIRIALARGFGLRGRVIDSQGRPAPGIILAAREEKDGSGASKKSDPDGSFAFSSLKRGSYALAGGSPTAGFGILTGVAAGAADVVLRLSPGGRIRVRVRDGNETPVEGAVVSVQRVNGESFPFTGTHWRTGDDGSVEVVAPAGAAEVRVWKVGLAGRGQATIASGEVPDLDVTMSEAAPPPAP